MINNITIQTKWEQYDYLYSFEHIADLHTIMNGKCGNKHKITLKSMNLKIKRFEQFREYIIKKLDNETYRMYNVFKFEYMLRDIVDELVNSNKKHFMKRHIKIVKSYDCRKRVLYDVHITNTLLAYMKRTQGINKEIMALIENIMCETEDNKKRKIEEIDELYDMCKDMFEEGIEKCNNN